MVHFWIRRCIVRLQALDFVHLFHVNQIMVADSLKIEAIMFQFSFENCTIPAVRIG